MKVLDKILIFNKIDKENIKIDLMKESSFSFFRGTSHLFFEHLSKLTNQSLFNDKDLFCWVQGDSHINNLGFSNKRCSSVKDIRFDINDFDEAFIASAFLDVIRFGVSIGFFFDELNNHQKDVMRNIDIVYMDTEIIEYFLKKYLKYASKSGHIEYKYSKSEFMKAHRKKAQKRADELHEKSRINKFTNIVDNIREFNFENEKIEELDIKEKEKLIKELSKIYNKEDILDVCRRVSAGVGSAHLDRYYMLLNYQDDTLLLEIKEQLNPAFITHFAVYQEMYNKKHSKKSASTLHIEAKQKMIENSDIHLKSFKYKKKDFLIKSIFNAKYSIDGMDFFTNKSLEEFEINLKDYIKFCAIALSNAHKKSSIDNEAFINKMTKIKNKDFYKIFTIILKSYATNVAMYTHFVRDLDKI